MRNQISKGNSWKWNTQDEPKEIEKHQELGNTHKPDQNMKILRVHWLLQILHPKLLSNHMTIAPPHKENNPLGVDNYITTSFCPPKRSHVCSISINPTQF